MAEPGPTFYGEDGRPLEKKIIYARDHCRAWHDKAGCLLVLQVIPAGSLDEVLP